MDNFIKVINPGALQGRVFCEIVYKDGKLSITGVDGPKEDGDCLGCAGQIDDTLREAFISGRFVLNDSWTAELFIKFLDAWRDWHLNDMRAGCEHQRALKWGEKQITIATYRLTNEAQKAQRDLKDHIDKALKGPGCIALTDAERVLYGHEWEIKVPEGEGYPVPPAEYTKKGVETKRASWVHEKEHPEGVLGKECPVCGYKYGTKWLKEDVPEDVLELLKSLPEARVEPAWV